MILHLGDTVYGRLEDILWLSRARNKLSVGFTGNTLNIEFNDSSNGAPDEEKAKAMHAEVLRQMGWKQDRKKAKP